MLVVRTTQASVLDENYNLNTVEQKRDVRQAAFLHLLRSGICSAAPASGDEQVSDPGRSDDLLLL